MVRHKASSAGNREEGTSDRGLVPRVQGSLDDAPEMGPVKHKGDARKEGGKRKEGFVDVPDGHGSSKAKKQKKSKSRELALAAAGGAVAGGERKDDVWDKKFEGQLFGSWSAAEKGELESRIKDWAAAHGHSDSLEKEDYDFLFKRRLKQGGRGAKLNESERKAFLEISKDFPTRNPKQIYGFATRYYDPNNHKGKWSEEEKEQLADLVELKGEKWTEIGEILERAGASCRDKWRSMRDKYQRGDWTPEELAQLKQLVNEQLAAQGAAPGRGPGEGNEHLPVRDNINWKAISLKLKTRSENTCCQKWYRIAPDSVAAGEWGAGDDTTMVAALRRARAASEADVDWAGLVRGRTLSQIKRRFKDLRQAIPKNHKLTFAEVVQKLVEKHWLRVPALPAPALT
jgi:cyclin-D-binding Myb-like transcription factor 1